MRSIRPTAEAIIRSLIREYRISYTLPGTPEYKDTLPNLGSASKTLGAFILGIAAIKGYIFVRDTKDAVLSFAQNIKNLPDSLADLDALADLITAENRRSYSLIEAESTFQTAHGSITSEKIDPVVIQNLYDAESKNYISIPRTITAKKQDEIRAIFEPIKSAVGSKVLKLASIVSSGQESFPSNFTDFGSFDDVDDIDDLDDNERSIANKAMTDGVATAIYNSIKLQMTEFIGAVSDYIDSNEQNAVIADTDAEAMRDELEKFTIEIAKSMEVTGNVKKILAG